MCNRYRPASVVRIRDTFGWTNIESGPDLRYNADGDLAVVLIRRQLRGQQFILQRGEAGCPIVPSAGEYSYVLDSGQARNHAVAVELDLVQPLSGWWPVNKGGELWLKTNRQRRGYGCGRYRWLAAGNHFTCCATSLLLFPRDRRQPARPP